MSLAILKVIWMPRWGVSRMKISPSFTRQASVQVARVLIWLQSKSWVHSVPSIISPLWRSQ